MRTPGGESCQPIYHQNKQQPHQATFKISGPLKNNLPNLKPVKKNCPSGAVQFLQLWQASAGRSPGNDCPGVPSYQRQMLPLPAWGKQDKRKRKLGISKMPLLVLKKPQETLPLCFQCLFFLSKN